PSGIHLDNASDISINAGFFESGFYNTNFDASVGIKITGDVEAVRANVQFGHGGVGVHNRSISTRGHSIYVNAELLTSRRPAALFPQLVPLVDVPNTVLFESNDMSE